MTLLSINTDFYKNNVLCITLKDTVLAGKDVNKNTTIQLIKRNSFHVKYSNNEVSQGILRDKPTEERLRLSYKNEILVFVRGNK